MLLAYVRNLGEGKVAEDRVREAAGDHKLKVRERIGAGARLASLQSSPCRFWKCQSWLGKTVHTGKGSLILRDGRRLPPNFQFGSDCDDVRSGYLHLDTSSIDPAFYGDRLRLVCENGADIQLVVVHFSDRYLAVTGRISPLAA